MTRIWAILITDCEACTTEMRGAFMDEKRARFEARIMVDAVAEGLDAEVVAESERPAWNIEKDGTCHFEVQVMEGQLEG